MFSIGGDKRDRTAAKPAASRLASQLFPLRSKNASRFEVSGSQTLFSPTKKHRTKVRCFPLVEISGIEPLTFPAHTPERPLRGHDHIARGQRCTGLAFTKRKQPPFRMTVSFGGDKRDRTADLLNAIQALTKRKQPPFRMTVSFGGDKRDRTADLLNAIQALSQLSYTPICELSAPQRKKYNSRRVEKSQHFFSCFSHAGKA